MRNANDLEKRQSRELNRRRFLELTLAGASTLAFSRGASAQGAPGEIKLGVVMPLSGRFASYGSSARPGIEFTVKMINERGGIKSLGGAKLRLAWADTKGDTKVTVAEIERLISDEKVTGIIGPFSSLDSVAANPLSDQYKIPFVSPFWTSAKAFTLNSRYSRTLNLTSNSYAPGAIKLFNLLKERHGLAGKKIGLLYDNSEYGRGIAEWIKKELERIGQAPSIDLPVTPPITDLGPSILRLRDSGADFLFVGFYYQEAVLYFRAADVLNYRVPAIGLGSGFIDPRLPGALGKETAARVLQFPVFCGNTGLNEDTKYPPLQAFLKATEKEAQRPGHSPGVEFDWYLLAAQTVLVFKNALESSASRDGSKVNDAILKMSLPRGSTDLVLPFYDPALAWAERNGQPLNQAVVFSQWQNGKPVVVYPEDVATAKPKL
jgi:branched-chain amino acid transport system substrate-binding protein